MKTQGTAGGRTPARKPHTGTAERTQARQTEAQRAGLEKLKICKQYGTGYFDNPLPKGCVYGRPTKSLYIYIDNFSQFKPEYRLTRFIIWIMDSRKESRFHETVISKHTAWYDMIFSFIEYHNLFDAKVEPDLYRIGQRPERKQPQNHSGYTYNVPYRHRRILEWEDSYCTETDAIQRPKTFIDESRVDKIKAQQKAIDTTMKKVRDKQR